MLHWRMFSSSWMPNQLEIISICNAHDHFGLGFWRHFLDDSDSGFGRIGHGKKKRFRHGRVCLVGFDVMSILGILPVERSYDILGKDSQAGRPPTSKKNTPKLTCKLQSSTHTTYAEGLKGGLDLPVFTWLPDRRGVGPEDEDALPLGSGLLCPCFGIRLPD